MSRPQVVRVFATTQEPDYDCPWQSHRPASCTGSGVLIGPTRILTGAHVVSNATFIQVQKIFNPDKAVAEVEAVCHDCDLAVLQVKDPAFFAGIAPAQIGQLPRLGDKVSVIGFPVGGEEISVTEGVVSRVEVQRYRHSQRHMLAVTVDAAINHGNSGGPVFGDDAVVGIAFQKLESADNIGEMVPAPVIHSFLRAAAGGGQVQMPALGLHVQNLENPLLRRRLGLGGEQSGILVTAVEYGSSAWGELRAGDALVAVDGHPIANSGTIAFDGRHRTRFDVVLTDRQVGGTLPLSLVRAGRPLDVELSLAPQRYLVPRAQYDCLPTYFVYGGLVFQPLTRNFLATWSNWWEKAPSEFLNLYHAGVRTEERHEVVTLAQILSDELNVGYGHLYYESIVAVNGRPPRDMRDLVRLVEETEGILELRTSPSGQIVLDTAAVRAGNARILARYHIPGDRSADLADST